MGVREAIARRAVRGAHVLMVTVPGWEQTRMAVEGELARRGWSMAVSPADADVLLMCGVPGRELGSLYEWTWSQIPGPRTRVTVLVMDAAAIAVEQAATALGDDAAQRDDARSRPRESSPLGQKERHEGHSSPDPAESDMDMDMDMDMPMPGGLPLASGGADRDGLEMDLLHVPLGPVLPNWPAGLVLRCALQGDVIVSAEVDVLAAGAASNDQPCEDLNRYAVIRHCDAAAQLLALAGWESASLSARSIREALREDDLPLADSIRELSRLRRRLGRSSLLRWSLRGVRTVNESVGTSNERAKAGPAGVHDVMDRLLEWLQDACERAGAQAGSQKSSWPDDGDEQHRLLAALPDLVTGSDITSARLTVASLALDTAALAQVEGPARD